MAASPHPSLQLQSLITKGNQWDATLVDCTATFLVKCDITSCKTHIRRQVKAAFRRDDDGHYLYRHQSVSLNRRLVHLRTVVAATASSAVMPTARAWSDTPCLSSIKWPWLRRQTWIDFEALVHVLKVEQWNSGFRIDERSQCFSISSFKLPASFVAQLWTCLLQMRATNNDYIKFLHRTTAITSNHTSFRGPHRNII